MKTKAVAEAKPPVVSRKKRARPAGQKKPTPRHSPPLPYRTVVEALSYDMDWVGRNLERLLTKWGHVYLAVRDHEVFDADPDENTLVMRLREKYGKQGFLVVSLDDPELTGEVREPEYVGVIDEEDLE